MEEIKKTNSVVDTTSSAKELSDLTDIEIAFQDSTSDDNRTLHAEHTTRDVDYVEDGNKEINPENVRNLQDLGTSTEEPIELKIEGVDVSQDCTKGIEPFEEVKENVLPTIFLPEATSAYVNDISVFCISQQGESHITNMVACQDRSEFRWVNDQVLLAAIADGVGSCSLSDYGAEAAVKSSLDYLEQYFKVAMKQQDFVFDVPEQLKAALSGAMQHAYDSVEKRAEELDVLSYAMQSTLTVTAYDGNTLYFAHAGDDGIVALNKDGVYAMVTARIKGEEASSVFPLQSKQWSYGKVNDVVAYIMATDGVLDAFVRPSSENNRVYYRFIEPVFYTKQTDAETTRANCKDWEDYLKSSTYRKVVSDDITFVGVVNQVAINNSKKPDFDDKEWNRQTEEYEKKRKAALYPPQSKKIENDKGIPRKKPIETRPHSSINTSDPKVIYSGNTSWSKKGRIGGLQNNQTGNAGYLNDKGRNTFPQVPEVSQKRARNTENRDMFVNGAKQIFEGVTNITVAATATLMETSGEVLSDMGELTGQAADKLKQRQLQRGRQNQSVDGMIKKTPNSTEQ